MLGVGDCASLLGTVLSRGLLKIPVMDACLACGSLTGPRLQGWRIGERENTQNQFTIKRGLNANHSVNIGLVVREPPPLPLWTS